ncbi:right-handed parallel beta-helix repeat-containing protein [Microbacterium karelineae]|uniref:right-handed parallel beta-helix repeat-containing protein n=1 Tax=Microbacterium karelineae TaxID=2654283 RepID=UPI0012E9D83D|nr:right-handed parallel beta-helix repeat-containing protein [Microbacterium karelineae]
MSLLRTFTRGAVAALSAGALVAASAPASASDGAAAEAATNAERWQIADVGSGAGSGGEVTENADGTLTFDARASGSKLASSEDGFQYFFTEIDPEAENFTLTGTFRVDDAAAKDGQSGFGVIAVDDLVAGSSRDRYFNSAGALITRYGEGTGATINGAPGGRFVRGYTGATDDATAGARDTSGSAVFDPDHRAELGTSSRFETGDEYELTLRRSNTGFHAIWHRDGDDAEVIAYEPEMLLQQDGEALYVGFAVARKIAVTVTDWSFHTIRPEDDDAAEERPVEYVEPTLDVDVTTTTPRDALEIPVTANFHGTGEILGAGGAVLASDIALSPGERATATVPLDAGANDLTVRATPSDEQPQLAAHERLASLDPVETPHTVTMRAYGEPGRSLRVAPDGSADGDGSPADPLDLHTAVAFAQPGQQIVLEGGTYSPTSAIVVERGRDGGEGEPIVLMSTPGDRATLDLSNSVGGGLHIRGDWWHVHDLEITGSGDKQKPMHIEGHHNVIERVESHHNSDTGIQISGRSSEPSSMWPSHNLVVSSISHNNADEGGNDADGFAAKLTVGEGNVFRYDIAYNNIDDGWDLYAKSTSGPIGTVVVEDSVAYANGVLEDDPAATGEGNGFKLGGESIPGDHLLRNALAFDNLGTGVTSNSGPDVRLDRVTSVDNARGVRLETGAAATAYEATGVLSWGGAASDALGLKQDDTSLLDDPTNFFDGAHGSDQVSADWFASTDREAARPEIAADGSIETHGLFELTNAAPESTGARFAANPAPTSLRVLPPVAPAHDDRPGRGHGRDKGEDHPGQGHGTRP